jgi:hypothetical protein
MAGGRPAGSGRLRLRDGAVCNHLKSAAGVYEFRWLRGRDLMEHSRSPLCPANLAGEALAAPSLGSRPPVRGKDQRGGLTPA